MATTVNYLIVAGGGGGGAGLSSGNGGGGGGGGGAVQSGSGHTVAPGSYTITVGTGGPAGTVGNDSVFDGITSKGGGPGGAYPSNNGGVGGSGGGGAGSTTSAGTGGTTSGSGGNAGGNGVVSASTPAGGGGGGGGVVGSGASVNVGGNGGNGTISVISGASVVYGGGGGGAGWNAANSSTNGTGGTGGGGAGNYSGPAAGTANLGGGGGGGDASGAAGGAGVVVISYPTGTINATGGVITIVGGNTIHTFNSSGTWTFLTTQANLPVTMGKSMRPFRNIRAGVLSAAALPDVPSLGYPTNGLQTVSTNPTLRWISHGASSFDIAFGTLPTPPTILTNQWPASYTPTTLTPGTTYYWQITAHSAMGTAVGPIWSFVAQPAPDPIDATHPCLNQPPLTYIVDRTQLRNQIIVTGGSTPALSPVTVGGGSVSVARYVPAAGLIPSSGILFNPAGGWIKSGNQYINYTSSANSFQFNIASWTTFPLSGTSNAASLSTSGLYVSALGIGIHVISLGVLVSYDGLTWGRNDIVSGVTLGPIGYSPTLGVIVILSIGGTDNTVVTSTDGAVWVTHALSITGTFWQSICWSTALGIFVAVGSIPGAGSNVATSPDGVTWTGTLLGNSVTSLGTVVWADALGKFFVYTTTNGSLTSAVYSSPDGVNWTAVAVPFGGSVIGSMAWSSTLKMLIVANGTNTFYTSVNGTNWVQGPAQSVSWGHVVWLDDGKVFISTRNAASGVNVGISSDGTNWTFSSSNFNFGSIMSVSFNSLKGVLSIAGNQNGGGLPYLETSLAVISFALTGIPSYGVGSIQYPIATGDAVNVVAIRDNIPAQVAAASAEGGDGVHQFPLSDGNLTTYLECNNAGDVQSSLMAFPILGVDYWTRDPKTDTGQLVHIDRPDLGILGDFLIQTVSVSHISTELGTYPVYHVKAASVKFTFLDAIRQFLLPS